MVAGGGGGWAGLGWVGLGWAGLGWLDWLGWLAGWLAGWFAWWLFDLVPIERFRFFTHSLCG